MNPILFIMGTQRSGTTLLTRILTSHPKVFIQNELNIDKLFGQNKSKETLQKDIIAQMTQKGDFQGVDIFGQDSDIVWGFKDPRLTDQIDELKQFLPESKFLVIVRDPRGVVNSYIDNKWGLGTNAYTGALRWKREVELQMSFMEQYPDNFHYLRYEDLVTDLKSTLMGVCAHLNIEYSDELLNYNKKNSYYKKKRENLSTFQNLQSSMAEKWKAELSQFEIGTIESVVGDLMSQHGYTPQGPKVELSRFQKLYYSLHQKFIGEIQLQYRWRRSRVVNHLKKPG